MPNTDADTEINDYDDRMRCLGADARAMQMDIRRRQRNLDDVMDEMLRLRIMRLEGKAQ